MPDPVKTVEMEELTAKVEALKQDIAEVAAMAKAKVVGTTTEWAKENPEAALGVVAGLAGVVGFALGILVGRNRG